MLFAAVAATLGGALGLGAAVPATAQDISFADQIQPIITERCVVCHSANPTQEGYVEPPLGVTFDTPEQVKERASMIDAYAVKAGIMPLNNETEMTQEERDLLGAWIAAGADISG